MCGNCETDPTGAHPTAHRRRDGGYAQDCLRGSDPGREARHTGPGAAVPLVIRCFAREPISERIVRGTDNVSMQIQEKDSDMFTDLDEQLVYEAAGSERLLHGGNGCFLVPR